MASLLKEYKVLYISHGGKSKLESQWDTNWHSLEGLKFKDFLTSIVD